jgi:hypothetical protein
MFSVSKEDILKREAEWKQQREQEHKKRNPAKNAN